MADNKITFTSGPRSEGDYLGLAPIFRMRAKDLPTMEQLEQMLQAEDADAAAKLLQKLGWPDLTGMSAPEIDQALSQRRESIFRHIAGVIPDDAVVEVFRLKYDYHNAKALVKGEGAGVGTEDLVSSCGRVSVERLRSAFEGDDYRAVPLTLGHAMAEAKTVLARTENPQLCDFVLDKAYFAEMLALARTVGDRDHLTPRMSAQTLDPFLVRYHHLLADCANLRIAVRCLRMGRDPEFMKTALIPDAGISHELIARDAYSSEGFAPLFASSPFRAAAALGMEAVKGGSMTKFEKECDDALLRYLAGQRILFVGPELAAWYLSAEETAIVDVRMILTGLRSGLDPQRLKERLRDTYV